MRQLIVRFLNVAVIAAVLIGYNTVLDKRDKEDQIARLSAELETTQLQKENLQAAAAASNTADTAASEAAEAEGQYVDGTYDGEADGFGGTIAVEVTVEGGQITDLAITSADGEDSVYLSNADFFPDFMLFLRFYSRILLSWSRSVHRPAQKPEPFLPYSPRTVLYWPFQTAAGAGGSAEMPWKYEPSPSQAG